MFGCRTLALTLVFTYLAFALEIPVTSPSVKILLGETENDLAGFSLALGNDVNGDELPDLLIGAPTQNYYEEPGAVYCIYGSRTTLGSPENIRLNDTDRGFKISGGLMGWSLSIGGDFNGDSIGDILVGSPYAFIAFSDFSVAIPGNAFVIFGKENSRNDFLISEIDGNSGFFMNGGYPYGTTGLSVSYGDFNGDSISDAIIGAPLSPNDNLEGMIYVVYGKTTPFDRAIDLLNLNPNDGVTIQGWPFSISGWYVESGTDINGDQIDDLAIATFAISSEGTSVSDRTYLVYGSRSFGGTIQLSDLHDGNDLNLGFMIFGKPGSGASTLSLGDVNGDSIGDVVLGSPGAEFEGSKIGSVFVVFGKNETFRPNLDLAELNGDNGFVIFGETLNSNTGSSVDAHGDFNGDNIKDILIGASKISSNGINESGKAYLIYGRPSEIGNRYLNLSELTDSIGFSILGDTQDEHLGASAVSGADMNGDGFDEIVVGTVPDSLGAVGRSFLVYGRPSYESPVLPTVPPTESTPETTPGSCVKKLSRHFRKSKLPNR